MSIHVAAGTEVSPATLNTIGDFDALVDDGFAADVGNHYTTIAAAIADGALSIFVKPGSYAGFTVTADGTRIVGANLGVMTSGTGFTGGVIITSEVTVSAGVDDVIFENLQVDTGSASDGFTIVGGRCTLINCRATNCDDGVSALTGVCLVVQGGVYSGNDNNGLTIAQDRSLVTGARIDSNAADGIEVTGATSIAVIGCLFDNNSAYGLNENGTGATCVFSGCMFTNTGTASDTNTWSQDTSYGISA